MKIESDILTEEQKLLLIKFIDATSDDPCKGAVISECDDSDLAEQTIDNKP